MAKGAKAAEAATDYNDILDRQWGDMPQPKNLPLGDYVLEGRNAHYKPGDGTKKGQVMIFDKVMQPMDTVDEDAFAALGPDYDLTANQIVTKFFAEEPRDWESIRKHLVKRGINVDAMTIKESLSAVTGARIIGYVDERSYENSQGEQVTENTVTSWTEIDRD